MDKYAVLVVDRHKSPTKSPRGVGRAKGKGPKER